MAFSVSPMVHKITLKPGETYEGKIFVANPLASTTDFYYKATLHPYSMNNNNSDFQTVTSWSEILDWITLENETGVLKPNDMKEITFTIRVPENPPAGGQYAMIAVGQDTSKDANVSGSSVKNIYEMASLIYAEIEGETTHACEISENSIPGFVAFGTPETTVKLINTGNVHETAKTTLKSKNIFTGDTTDYTEKYEKAIETLVMPSSERVAKRDLEGLPQLGIFEVVQEVECFDSHSYNSTIMVVCPIWFIALLILLLVSIISTIIWRVHIHRKKLA